MTATSDLKVIAFYLPQFHPIPENDRWWGKGFTEWTNVTRAKPLFEGHYQPHLPADLGFYDLRISEVQQQQVAMAREYGVHGFCFYYYWFGGRRLLERPLNAFLADQTLDCPFCIMWANESWTRRWDGLDQEILLEQNHSEETDAAFILDVLPILKDPRYIRVGGAPFLSVYRAALFPSPVRTTQLWREIAKQQGIPRLHLCAVESFGLANPHELGFDSAMEFPPHGATVPDSTSRIDSFFAPFQGVVFDYRKAVESWVKRPNPTYPLFRTVMTSWDNTPRRGSKATMFVNSSPKAFEIWLAAAARFTRAQRPFEDQLLFVNAWNEWAEGAHLEPDQRFGHQYLNALRNVVSNQTRYKRDPSLKELMTEDPDHSPSGVCMNEPCCQPPRSWPQTRFIALHRMGRLREGGTCQIDRFAHLDSPDAPLANTIYRNVQLLVEGWAMVEGTVARPDSPVILTLINCRNGDTHFAEVVQRVPRPDVASIHKQKGIHCGDFVGFRCVASLAGLRAGTYRLGVIQLSRDERHYYIAYYPHDVFVGSAVNEVERRSPFPRLLPVHTRRYRLARESYRWIKRRLLPRVVESS